MRIIQVASGWIFSPDHSHILVVDNIGGKWSLPGGGVEDGEHIEDAVIREVWEEVGLHAKPTRLMAVGEGFYKARQEKLIFFSFLMELTDPAQQPSIQMPEEIAEIRWVHVDDIKTLLPWFPVHPHEALNTQQTKIYRAQLSVS
jgi:8-oxo-dGTP diphosphatase